MDGEEARPGPKPKRLYLRLVRVGEPDDGDLPATREVRAYVQGLDRVGRLVAAGRQTNPTGHLLIFRARSREEAARILRTDPFRGLANSVGELVEWDPETLGGGVNLEPPPARGAGRITALQRVAVVVHSQADALRWYREVLGLVVRAEDPSTGFVELSLGRGAAAISLVEPRPEWGEPYYSESRARIGGPTGIAFQTDSVVALAGRLVQGGARLTEPPARQPWGGVALRFADPDGNEFLAFQERTDPGVPVGRPKPPVVAAGRPVRWARAAPRRKPH